MDDGKILHVFSITTTEKTYWIETVNVFTGCFVMNEPK